MLDEKPEPYFEFKSRGLYKNNPSLLIIHMFSIDWQIVNNIASKLDTNRVLFH